jgi:hypothetical protein
MPKNKKRTPNDNTFQTAVLATPEVANCFQAGLQALGKYSQKVIPANVSKCEGSVDIDACTRAIYPTENRWDYALSYDSKVYFVEVHSAETGEVSTVLRKLQWLKDWLNRKAPEINKLKADAPYFWIQSGRFSILKNSSQAKQIAQSGIRPIPRLNLPR